MISSRFVRNIMDYLFEDLPELEIPIAKQQLNCLTDIFYEYTRYGLFVDFDYCPDIHKYQLPYKSLIIGDLTIESPDLEHGATAMICISNGLVSPLVQASSLEPYIAARQISYNTKLHPHWFKRLRLNL